MSVNVSQSRSVNALLPIPRLAYDTVVIALPDVAVAETDETKIVQRYIITFYISTLSFTSYFG